MGYHLSMVKTTCNLERNRAMTTTRELLAQLNALRLRAGKTELDRKSVV